MYQELLLKFRRHLCEGSYRNSGAGGDFRISSSLMSTTGRDLFKVLRTPFV